MRSDAVYYWIALVSVVILAFLGYKKYMQGSGRYRASHKATNAMSSLKQNVRSLHKKYDSVLGDGGSSKPGTKTKKTRRQEIQERNKRLLDSTR